MSIQSIDQLGQKIILNYPPQRIISLVPSITELLYDLGLAQQLVGRTKFCIHPSSVKSIPKIGGTKNVKIDRIIALQPDIIIANKEENQREQIEELSQQCPVWISDVATFSDAMDMIEKLGQLFQKEKVTQAIISQSRSQLAELTPTTKQKAAYLIWQKPYMTIGRDTYIHNMLGHCGFENVFGEQTRYPIFTLSALKERQPDIILLSSEPFPFKTKHIIELQKDFPYTPIKLVDGEAFSWYGTRFLKTAPYLKEIAEKITF
ncbi:MAG: helical backbone metal receptor [Bacteroidota bacterium]